MASMETFLRYQRESLKVLPDYIDSFVALQQILKDVPVIDRDSQTTPEVISSLKEYATKYNGELKYFFGYLREFIPLQYIEEDPVKSLKEIKVDADISSFTLSDNHIRFRFRCVMYDPVSNTNFDFGFFNIYLTPSYVTCEPSGENIFKDDFAHPYVSRDYRLCLGDFDNAYKSYWRSMSFGDCWFIVKKVMTKYGIDQDDVANATAPHARLSSWTGFLCVDCDELVKPSETYLCEKTEQKLCKTCAEAQTDQVSKKIYMSNFVGHCESCDMTRFDVKIVDDKRICRSCRSAAN